MSSAQLVFQVPFKTIDFVLSTSIYFVLLFVSLENNKMAEILNSRNLNLKPLENFENIF